MCPKAYFDKVLDRQFRKKKDSTININTITKAHYKQCTVNKFNISTMNKFKTNKTH